jgi:predicted ATP-grasp superfamily ATP-dependent carboligase
MNAIVSPGPDRRGALILGGAHGSLALVRSLGRRGIPVWFVTDDHPIAGYSRYAERSFAWGGANDEGAIEFLKELGRQHGLDGWLLIAGGDPEVRLLSQHHAALAGLFRVAVPPWEAVRWAHDKRLTYQRAQSLGIDHPLCYEPRDLRQLAELDCRFPVVLKPSIRERKNAFTRAKAWQADDRASLMARYEAAAALVGERAVVLQELIPGGGEAQFSYAAVWQNGSPLASLVARRSRQYPVDFGFTSTFVETVECREVEEAACRFLRSLDYSGLVEIEFKYDRRDGRYKLLDVNARAWTWNALGAKAGIDFAHLLWRSAMGETIEPIRAQAEVGWMHETRDVVAACIEMWRGRLSPAEYLRSWRKPLVFAALAKDDPLPGLVDLPLAIARVLKRSLPDRARQPGTVSGLRPSL